MGNVEFKRALGSEKRCEIAAYTHTHTWLAQSWRNEGWGLVSYIAFASAALVGGCRHDRASSILQTMV